MPYELLTTPLNIALAQGLAATGRFAAGAALIEETIRAVEAKGDDCYMPELLRLKGGLLLSTLPPDREGAEQRLTQSLEWSRRQGARAWELRTAVDLAAMLVADGRSADARQLLQPLLDGFAEGSDTADLKAAERLLASMG
jgi:predicted ATPase